MKITDIFSLHTSVMPHGSSGNAMYMMKDQREDGNHDESKSVLCSRISSLFHQQQQFIQMPKYHLNTI